MNKTKVGDRVVREYRWKTCYCGLPAVFRITYLLHNCRTNPGSKGYRRDDVSWAADAEEVACREHQREIERDAPDGMRYCATFPLARFRHMGFYTVEVKDNGEAK